LNYIGLW